MKTRPIWDSAKVALKEFSTDRVLQLSAALAYYATFSIGPLLILAIGVASLAMGERSAQHQVHDQLQGLLGAKTASLLQSMMTAGRKGGGLLATIVGAVGLAFGATGVFAQLQQSLNTIWEVQQKPGTSLVGYMLNRALSMLMVLAIGLLLVVSTVLSAFISSLKGGTGLPNWVWHLFNELLWLGIISGFFAMVFKYLPLVKIRWRDVWRGAIVTSALFVAGKYLLGLYLGSIGAQSSYGAASSFVIFLMFVYYASVIFLFGAEFTKAWAERTGSQIQPSQYAVRLSVLQRAEEGRVSPERLRQAERKSDEPPPEEQQEAA